MYFVSRERCVIAPVRVSPISRAVVFIVAKCVLIRAGILEYHLQPVPADHQFVWRHYYEIRRGRWAPVSPHWKCDGGDDDRSAKTPGVAHAHTSAGSEKAAFAGVLRGFRSLFSLDSPVRFGNAVA